MGRVDGVLRFGMMAATDPFDGLKTRAKSCKMRDMACI